MDTVPWFPIIYTAVLIVFIGLLLQYLSSNNHLGHWKLSIIRSLWSIQGPKSIPILGGVSIYWGSPAEVFNTQRKVAKQFPAFYKVWALHLAAINIYDADHMETILSSSKLITKSDIYDWMSPWLKKGLLTSSGERWKLRRKLLTPAFHFNILQNFVSIFEEHSIRVVELLRNECTKESTNVIPFVTEFAIHSICETTMGCKVDPKSETIQDYKAAIFRFAEIMLYRLFRPWLYPNVIFYMTPMGIQVKRVLKILHKFTSDVIDERLRTWDQVAHMEVESASGKTRLAMLDLLISQMKDGANIDINGIREEVDTFMFEGHDTTSMGISFLLLLLANNPHIQERIVAEVRSVLGNAQRTATHEELQSMNYLEMCIKESLRIYPPVPFMSRQVTSEFKLNNHTVSPGMFAHLHIYDLHRDPKLWPDPERFDPDRFLPENLLNRHPFAYIPFSAGARNCIGQKFAMFEMKSFVSKILLEYILEPVDTPASIIINADLVLRPRDGIRVKFRKRC